MTMYKEKEAECRGQIRVTFSPFFLKGRSMATQNLRIFSIPVDIRTRHLPISCHDGSYLLVQLRVLLPKHYKWEIILANNLVIVTSCLHTSLQDA